MISAGSPSIMDNLGRPCGRGESVPEAADDDSRSSDIVCFSRSSVFSSASVYALWMVSWYSYAPTSTFTRSSGGQATRRATWNALDMQLLRPQFQFPTNGGATSDVGTTKSSASAALSLMTSSNLVGSSTGRSAGFAPFSHMACRSPERVGHIWAVGHETIFSD